MCVLACRSFSALNREPSSCSFLLPVGSDWKHFGWRCSTSSHLWDQNASALLTLSWNESAGWLGGACVLVAKTLGAGREEEKQRGPTEASTSCGVQLGERMRCMWGDTGMVRRMPPTRSVVVVVLGRHQRQQREAKSTPHGRNNQFALELASTLRPLI